MPVHYVGAADQDLDWSSCLPAGNMSPTSHYVLGPASDPFADPYPGSVDSVLFIGDQIIDRLLIVSSPRPLSFLNCGWYLIVVLMNGVERRGSEALQF